MDPGNSAIGPMLESGDPEYRGNRTAADPEQPSPISEQVSNPCVPSLLAPTPVPKLGASIVLPGDGVAAELCQSTRRLVGEKAFPVQSTAVTAGGAAPGTAQNPIVFPSPIYYNTPLDHAGYGNRTTTSLAAPPAPAQQSTTPFIVRRVMKPSRIDRHLDARRLRQSWMSRVSDDFVLKPGSTVPRRGVLDRSSFHWEMGHDQTPDEYHGIDEDSVQTLKYVPDEDWLYVDVTGAAAPLDHASISRLGKVARPLLPSDNGPKPSAGERLFVIEDARRPVQTWTQPPPRVVNPPVLPNVGFPAPRNVSFPAPRNVRSPAPRNVSSPAPPNVGSPAPPTAGFLPLSEKNERMMRRVAAIQAETRRLKEEEAKAEEANAILEAVGKAAALAKVRAARANADRRNAEKGSGSAAAPLAPPAPLTATTLKNPMASRLWVPEQMNSGPSGGPLTYGQPGVAPHNPTALQNTKTEPNLSTHVSAAPGSLANQEGGSATTKRPAPGGPSRPAKLARMGNAPGYDHDQMGSQASGGQRKQ